MTRQNVVIVLVQCVSWGTAAVAGSILPPLGVPVVIVIGVLLVGMAGTAAAGIGQLRASNRDTQVELNRLRAELKQKNAAVCRANIHTHLVQVAKIAGHAGLITRSCLFLIGADEKMYIAQHHNMGDSADVSIRLEKYQGCTGHAWGRGKQTVADLSAVSNEDLSTTWKLTPEQIAVTTKVKSILSTPIRYPGGIIVGILSIDSSGPLAESGLNQSDIMDTAVQSAEALAGLLQLGEIISTDGETV